MTMPPKAAPRPKPPLSKSRELVPVGPREVFKKSHGRQRDENGHKPLTARALVLRNGKHGAMGTGEVVLASRMSGREKLDLLAGTYTVIDASRSHEACDHVTIHQTRRRVYTCIRPWSAAAYLYIGADLVCARDDRENGRG